MRFLRERFPRLPAEENFSFARHTSIGCGGTAAVAVFPADGAETARLLFELARAHIPYCFIGAGANVLPADGAYEGVVIRFSRMQTLEAEGCLVRVGAGVTGGRLLRFLRERELGGFEALTGIPMTVGGAVAMNAGVREFHIGERVVRVRGAEKGGLREFGNGECRFGEKESAFLDGIAVTEVLLYAKASPRGEIERRLARYRALRRGLPKGRSMGCAFVNPNGLSAGAIIDACGLKGLRVGGARVSELHANFILNEGASAAEISELALRVREEVYARCGILLREEFRRIP